MLICYAAIVRYIWLPPMKNEDILYLTTNTLFTDVEAPAVGLQLGDEW